MAQARQQQTTNIFEGNIGPTGQKRARFGGQDQALQSTRARAVEHKTLRQAARAVALFLLRVRAHDQAHRVVFHHLGERNLSDPLAHLQNSRIIQHLAQRRLRRRSGEIGDPPQLCAAGKLQQ